MNKKELSKYMNYLTDKKNLFVIIILSILSCNPCKKTSIADFEKNINLFKKVKEVVITKKLLENSTIVELNQLNSFMEPIEIKTLEKLNFIKVSLTFDVLVFKFSYSSKENLLDNKIDQNLKTKTSNKSCNNYIFFSEDHSKIHNVASFPRYAECRKKFQKISENWYFSSQLWYCAD